MCGFNFAIVAGLFVGFFGWLMGRWRGMLAAFLGIALYAALAGASAGVVRAAIMGGLGMFAAQIGRRQYGLNGLAFVAALTKDHRLGPVTALLLADSGYAPLNPEEWIERWGAQVVLLSVAAGDEQGRPDPQVLQALGGRTLLRTDQNGWIELSTDGEQLWVEVERIDEKE